MNLFISYNWLKEFVAVKQPSEKVAELLSLHALSVERISHLAKQWEKMVIGKVVKTEKHPNADKLTVNTVDVGGKIVQIICGAPNVQLGMLAAVALPGARVRWHGEGDLVELAATKIRGVESFGMMCAGNEIGLEKMPDAAKGILDLSWTNARPGTALATALDMDDVLMDVEVTSNRPDAMSVVGVAREVAAVTGSNLKFQISDFRFPKKGSDSLSVKVEAKQLCTRFAAVAIDGVKVGPSPWWMQKRLLMAGLRPINNIVDITNYVMLEQGKPLHAFDALKVKPHPPPLLRGEGEGEVECIVVRTAKKGESLVALDGKKYNLNESMLVVANGEKPMAIAGVMGGEGTSVTEKTTSIIFESAVFDPVSIRRTARTLNLHSEASNLFEKGLSDESVLPALARAVELTLEIAGGQVASKVVDQKLRKLETGKIILQSETIERMLGVSISQKDVIRYLTASGFSVKKKKVLVTRYSLLVTVPWWRDGDVTIEEDLVEEISRLYGYHRLPSKLPDGPLGVQDEADRRIFFWERRAKELLRGAGYTETMSYSFISEKDLRKLGLDPAQSIRILNPLVDDHAYLRPRPITALLDIVRAHEQERSTMHLFELARMFRPRGEGLPDEPLRLAGVVVAQEAFREAKGAVEVLLRGMGIAVQRVVFGKYEDDEYAPWVDQRRSVRVLIDGKNYGSVVMLTPKAQHDFDVQSDGALFRIRFEELVSIASMTHTYTPLPKYPPVLRDLAFILPKRVVYADIEAMLRKQPLVASVELFDLFESEKIGKNKKSLAFHVVYQSPERTLTADEVDRVQSDIVQELEKTFGATLRDS